MHQHEDQRDTSSSVEKQPVEKPKIEEIRDAARQRDADRLRRLAESRGGLLQDDLRRLAWPILLGLSGPDEDDDQWDDAGVRDEKHDDSTTDGSLPPWQKLPPHKDESQVQLDVDRSFVYYPSHQSDEELRRHKGQLFALIAEVLRRHPYLCYFQGYHDICQVFLLVLDPAWRARAVARLSVLRIRDFMLPTLGPTTTQLRLLPEIISKADPKLYRHLAAVEPFYALSGTLTMYAHNIEAYSDIARLFDVLIAREPVFSIYMFAQIVIDRRDEILEIDEADMLHVILGKVPPNMDLDALVAHAVSLRDKYPPTTLWSWRYISSASVLKTVYSVRDCAHQSMAQGYEYFQQQVDEIKWLERQQRMKALLWAYRKPAANVGVAVAVGLLSMYLFRNSPALRSWHL